MEFTPKHGTDNLVLRWIANKIFEPISMFFLKMYGRWGTMYTATFDSSEYQEALEEEFKNDDVDYHGGWGDKKNW